MLAQNCYGCHGPAAQQAGLRLDLRQNALRGGDYGPVIIPGKSADSKLIKRVADGDGGHDATWDHPTGAETVCIAGN
jgi:mono/diheme cytochrome c family protein